MSEGISASKHAMLHAKAFHHPCHAKHQAGNARKETILNSMPWPLRWIYVLLIVHRSAMRI